MADLTISIANQIQCFGISPSTKWGSAHPGMSWGVSKWGEGTLTTQIEYEKALSETQTIDQTIATLVDFNLSLAFSVPMTFEMGAESIKDPAGYFRVFTRPTIDAETQVISTYTRRTAGTQTYSAVVATSTVWS